MPIKKGSWWFNWAEIKNETKTEPSSHIYMQIVLQGEACTEPPSYTVFLPPEPALKEFLESYFNE